MKRSLEGLRATVEARAVGRTALRLLARRPAGGARLGGRVRSVMTSPVVTCAPGETLHRAAQIMWEHDCGAVPVVDGEGRAVGVITDRDLTMGAYTQGLPLVAIPVGRVAASVVHSVPVEASLDEVAALMSARGVRRVVVTGAGREVLGIVALADIARHVASLGSGRRREAAAALADLLAALSERRPDGVRAERAAE